MTIVRVVLLFALVAGIGLAVPLRALAEDDPAKAAIELKKNDFIIFFGDSLTALAGKEAPKKYVTKGYVRIVRETLQETHKDQNIEGRLGRHRRAYRPRSAQARGQGRDRQEADHRRHPDRLQRRPPDSQGARSRPAWKN